MERTESYRTTMIYVDEYENDALTGYLHNFSFRTGKRFKSTMEFVKTMEFMMDSINFPQTATKLRTFDTNARYTEADVVWDIPKKGKRATFILQMMYRQHASWQGRIIWIETGRERIFRSVLELLLLMDEALRSGE